MHFAKLCEAAMFQFTSRLQALGQPCLAAVTTAAVLSYARPAMYSISPYAILTCVNNVCVPESR